MPWRPSLDWRGTAEPRYSTRQRQIGVESPMVRSFIRNGVQGSLGQTGERTGRVFLSSFEAVSSCPRTFEEPTTTTTANHTITLTPTTDSRQGVPGRSSNPCTTTTTTGHRKHRALSLHSYRAVVYHIPITYLLCSFSPLRHTERRRRRTCEPDYDDETTHKP